MTQATSGYYSDDSPTFSKDGKYLFFQTNRNMDPVYSALGDGTWVYPNATQIGAISLSKSVASLLAPKNDTITVTADKKPDEKKPEEKKANGVQVSIDFDGLESRVVILPVKPGNFGKMTAIDDKLVFMRYPRTGSGDNGSTLMYYDVKEREEKTILDKVNNYVVSADGKSILISSNGQFGIIAANAAQKMEKPIPTNGLVMNWVAREEWNQIFNDTWRRYRDFFYDPNMQGVDWEDMRKRYGALIKDARTRWDITNIQSNMQAELAAGHTYTNGGDVESVTSLMTGFLGIEWAKDGDRYKIKRIVKPAAWNTEVRSPFDRSGVEVKEGDYILAVNGIKLDPNKDPYATKKDLLSTKDSMAEGNWQTDFWNCSKDR